MIKNKKDPFSNYFFILCIFLSFLFCFVALGLFLGFVRFFALRQGLMWPRTILQFIVWLRMTLSFYPPGSTSGVLRLCGLCGPGD